MRLRPQRQGDRKVTKKGWDDETSDRKVLRERLDWDGWQEGAEDRVRLRRVTGNWFWWERELCADTGGHVAHEPWSPSHHPLKASFLLLKVILTYLLFIVFILIHYYFISCCRCTWNEIREIVKKIITNWPMINQLQLFPFIIFCYRTFCYHTHRR